MAPSPRTHSVAALICAAGSGSRAGGEVAKQFAEIAGRPMLALSAGTFLDHPRIDRLSIVVGAGQEKLYAQAMAALADHPKLAPPAIGGATRQASVRLGLEALESERPDIVLVHDAARPFAGADLVSRAIEAAAESGGAVPGVPAVDTFCEVDADGWRGRTLDRGRMRAIQTPQAFRFDALLAAHRKAAAQGRDDFTDDGALFTWAGGRVALFEGEPRNAKMTTPEQFDDELLRRAGREFLSRGDVRTGMAFDVHAFRPGDHVILGGVRIPHERGLLGHSDADVALHALTDAVLGAISDGDIGQHFPPSDQRWAGADSARFLEDAVARVRALGGVVAQLDLTVIGETPKIGPHREAMRASIARIAGVPLGRVAVKATTTEKLGFTGRREGLAALASATVRLPFREEF